MTIIVSVFLRGYRGKTVDFAEVSKQHRTTTAYFLNDFKLKRQKICEKAESMLY